MLKVDVKKKKKNLLILDNKLIVTPNLFFIQIERYNTLMGIIRTALTNLEQGIKGLVVMTMELENTFQCIFDGRVPPTWLKVCLVLFYFKVEESIKK